MLVALAWKLPDRPACAFTYTVPPETNVSPLAPDNDTDGAAGALVSTFTVVLMLTLLPTLSTPVSVYR